MSANVQPPRPMSTLILRDATLAICGAPEARGDQAEHLTVRLAEVALLDDATLEECRDVLLGADGLGEQADLEVLSALMILGLGRPDLAEPKGFSGLALGRRVAARLEREGQPDGALAIIETLRERHPGHQALERDYDAVLGRLGMVLNLADRYFDRAQQLIGRDELEEGIGWLREVLLLDPSRNDVARQIRDLKLRLQRPMQRLKINWGLILLGIGIPVALGGVVVREYELIGRYESLPGAVPGDLASSEARLAALDAFAEENQVWHAAISMERERTELRIDVERMRTLDQATRLRAQEQRDEALLAVDNLRARARRLVGFSRYREALDLLEQADREAPDDWGFGEQTKKDIAALRAHLSGMSEETHSK